MTPPSGPPHRRSSSRSQLEARFLSGRHTLLHELIWLLKIGCEFFRGFWGLRKVGPAVTVFGSARLSESDPYYQKGRELGARLAREGYTVMTGGGPGLMEAANRGAKEVGGHSIGCNIVLPHEQHPNPYLDRVVTFYYFFARKVMLVKYSYAFVILPGGFGTLDEMTEAITLIQTGKLYDFPIILVGREYWSGFYDWVRNTLVARGTVSADSLDFIHLTDHSEEVLSIIRDSVRGLNLKLRPLASSVD